MAGAPWWLTLLCFAKCFIQSSASDVGDFGKDLTRFVTRPELRAPLFKITYHEKAKASPGLWFLGPYAKVDMEPFASDYYQACSTGPHIYDGNGDLVWSGACQSLNQNSCDFRVFTDDEGNEQLSTIFHGSMEGWKFGSVIPSNYDLSNALNITGEFLDMKFNMHEFKVIEGGRSALYIMYDSVRADVSELKLPDIKVGWITNIGFREVDLRTKQTTFEWWSNREVSIMESSAPIEEKPLRGPYPEGWNYFHPNSVDKSAEGDYMISGRFVDTIYKVSGKDGSIIWRLGGRKSYFQMDGFNFSKQHDAQFLGNDPVTGAELISLFDNAQALQSGWSSESTSSTSSCMIVALDYKTMTAKLIKQFYRPDGGLTALRGNFQHLPNGNMIGAWSENAYVSEHAPNGEVILEAKFASNRFVTYRAYKFNFTGHPIEPPTLKVVLYGVTAETSTTVCYVSWNGATEVAQWRFCREDLSRCLEIGTVPKTGFETTFVTDGQEEVVYAEAIAKNGSVIGRSELQQAEVFQGAGIQRHPAEKRRRQTPALDVDHDRSEL